MSAQPKPELVRDEQIDALIAKAQLDGHIIVALKKKNERLAAERLEVELEASIEVAKAKFAAAQAHQLIAELRASVKALEDAQNRTGNIVQGLMGGPSADEWERVRSNVSYLMGAHTP